MQTRASDSGSASVVLVVHRIAIPSAKTLTSFRLTWLVSFFFLSLLTVSSLLVNIYVSLLVSSLPQSVSLY